MTTNQATATETIKSDNAETRLTRILIVCHVAKRSVSSELQHEAEAVVTLNEATDTRETRIVMARRFERAAACPIATARALYQGARENHPNVPCELRFA